jgi:hypothetical protein
MISLLNQKRKLYFNTISVTYFTIAERKIMGSIQIKSPNIIGLAAFCFGTSCNNFKVYFESELLNLTYSDLRIIALKYNLYISHKTVEQLRSELILYFVCLRFFATICGMHVFRHRGEKFWAIDNNLRILENFIARANYTTPNSPDIMASYLQVYPEQQPYEKYEYDHKKYKLIKESAAYIGMMPALAFLAIFLSNKQVIQKKIEKNPELFNQFLLLVDPKKFILTFM